GRYLTHDDLLGPGAVDQPPVDTTSRVNGRDTAIQVGGTTAAKLVQLAGVGLPALTDMSVTFAGSSTPPVTLTANDVKNGFSGDPLGGGPRYVTFDAGAETEVRFFEPLRASSDARTYSVDPPGRTDLQVNLDTTGHRLTVRLTATSTQIDAGQSVTFDAQTTPGPTGPASTYAWDFEGAGQPVDTQVPGDSHVYAADGTYQASVTVTTLDGSSGTDSVVIQVGKPASGGTSTTPSPPAAALSGGGAPAGGGAAKNGGGSASPNAPNSGPAHTPAKSPPATARPVARRPAPAAPPQTAATALSPPAKSAARRVAAAGSGKPPPASLRRPPPKGAGVPVRGILLAGVTAVQSALPLLAGSPEATIAARSAARAGAGSPAGVLGWLAGTALCLLLLLSGALREISPLSHRLPRSA
ncbi:MAG: hypothetical protein QOD61_666, partial [Solirubrobacteraceae bacterium]|nr:hypothetical protein [Solirubrobacteraceae bacterium]